MGKERKLSQKLREMYRDYKAGRYDAGYEKFHLIEDMIDLVEQDERARNREKGNGACLKSTT